MGPRPRPRERGWLSKSKKMCKILVILLTMILGEPIWPDIECPEDAQEYFNEYLLQIDCPCCKKRRHFPSFEYFQWRVNTTTQEQLRWFRQEITNSAGEIMPKRYCRFCGHKTERN